MPVGAPLGNKNAAKAKRWQKALERVLAREYGDVDKGLEHLAFEFVKATKAMTEASEKRGPSIDGFKEVADRFDGRPAQAVQLSGDADAPLTINHKVG